MKYRYVIHDEDTASFTSDTEYENVDLAWFAGEAEARSLLRGWGAEWWVVDEQGNEVELDHDPYDPDGGDARDIQHEQQRWRDFNELGYIRPEHMSETEWERERRRDERADAAAIRVICCTSATR